MKIFRHLRYNIGTYGLRTGLYQTLIWSWFGPFKYGVENLFRYFKVVWNDRDWDYSFWIAMNIKKLGSMEYNIRNNGCHLNCERDADNIRKAILALKRLQAGNYLENALIFHEKQYGAWHYEFIP
jgi:hypothetical protein